MTSSSRAALSIVPTVRHAEDPGSRLDVLGEDNRAAYLQRALPR